MYIDTHTHINSEQFAEDQTLVIQHALEKGVSKMIIPAIDSTYTSGMLNLTKQYPENIFLMMGVHPTHIKENYEEELAIAWNWLQKASFVAIGEIGIDLFWDKTYLKEQMDAFSRQIQWAKQLNLPINIHCRDAFNEVFDVLEQEKSPLLKGVFHCFTGTFADAQKAIDYNLKLGIGGVTTFKNGKIDQFLHNIPLKHIVLETDAPYLAPVPYRGKRNESAYIPLIAQKLADIYQTTIEEVAKITTQNAIEVFKI